MPQLIVDTIKKICKEYWDRVYICEEQKWDLEREVRKRDYEVQLLHKKQIPLHKLTHACGCFALIFVSS